MPDKPVFRPGIMLENLHQKSPLIHNITNYVTANDCANILLACGASLSWRTTRWRRRISPASARGCI